MSSKILSGIACALIMSAHIAAFGALPPKPVALSVVSSSFKNGSVVPKPFTADGADMSPALAWSALPSKTKSVAVFCEDPDAPGGVWSHWILFNLPATTKGLDQGVAKTAKLASGAIQGTNDFGKIGYNGPSPPRGKQHRYFFHVYALDRSLSLNSTAKQADFRKALAGSVLAEGVLMGTYQR